MKIYTENEQYKLYQGNMLDMLEVIEPNTIDSIVTDPPYELNFMGKGWDNSGIAFQPDTWKKCYEVLKDGGYLLAFGGSRTFHRIACAIEDAGFEIRDTIMWLYGSGFPKSMDISKQIDKKNKNTKDEYVKFGNWLQEHREKQNLSRLQLGQCCFDFDSKREDAPIRQYETGVNIPTKEIYLIIKEKLNLDNSYDWLIEREEAEREVIGQKKSNAMDVHKWLGEKYQEHQSNIIDITAPSTDLAKQWKGWGTALKPSFEPIIVARKPFKGSLVDNVIENGVGGINIDECRVGNEELHNSYAGNKNSGFTSGDERDDKGKGMFSGMKKGKTIVNGRFPANTILTYDKTDFEEVCGGFPITNGGKRHNTTKRAEEGTSFFKEKDFVFNRNEFNDSGSASRYFYCAKASKRDRDEGLDEFEEKTSGQLTERKEGSAGITAFTGSRVPKKNTHPTVKPTDLMQYLVRLVTPNNGTILDPFNGSGSTGKAVMYENKDKNKNYKYIGIELTKEYLPIAKARIDYVCNIKIEQPTRKQISIFDLDASNSKE